MTRPLTFDDAVSLLAGATVFGINPSLEGVTELAEALGRPQDRFASVQITGTNGKTSTSRLTAALLRGEGLRVGLYTSPHLERYPERIEVDGSPVTDADFARALTAARDAAEKLRGAGALSSADGFTEFELLTAAALWLFADLGIDIAVLEVGLGGRWDATSVVSPSVAVITGVALDHTAILGSTVERIAADKAAIIKAASAPVLGPGTAGLEDIFLARAESLSTHARAVREGLEFSPVAEELTIRYRVTSRPDRPGAATTLAVDGVHARYDALSLAAPSYQAANVATAVAAAEAALGRALDAGHMRTALGEATFPGRFELVRDVPPVIVDGSHNPQAATALAGAVREAFPDREHRPRLLLAVLADKDAAGIVRALAGVGSAIAVTAPDSPRALPAEELAAIVERETGHVPRVFRGVPEALAALLGESGDGLVVAGSLVTAGTARGWLLHGS